MPWVPDGMQPVRGPKVVHTSLWPLDPASTPGTRYESSGSGGTGGEEGRDCGTEFEETCGCRFEPKRRLSRLQSL